MNTFSVLFNTNEVHKRGSTRANNNIEESEEPVDVNENHQSRDNLQQPVKKIKLHSYQISVLPFLSGIFTDTTHSFVLVFSKPNKINYSIEMDKMDYLHFSSKMEVFFCRNTVMTCI